MRHWFIFILVLAFGVSSADIAAQSDDSEAADKQDHLYIVYDSSGSMWGELADKSRKYEAGRTALSELLDKDVGNRQIALRAYGHRERADCRDSQLIVPFSDSQTAKAAINNAVTNIRPTGKTPISYSLREALKDFGDRSGDILLISDGIETCDIDPCELMREWQAANVSIRVHVVGVGLNELEQKAMACIAETSGGKYFDADSAEGFSEAVNQASEQVAEPEAKPIEDAQVYRVIIKAIDSEGKSYTAEGTLYKEGEAVSDLSTIGSNEVDGPGGYEIEMGVVLNDGSIYKPVRQSLTVEEYVTHTEVIVVPPAIVSATFKENDEDHQGSFVTAYQGNEKAFGFRAFDEALARPGEYEFRAQPNADNELSLTETLIEGQHTELLFDLTTTIQFYIEFVMPDGDTFRRGSELWRNNEKRYDVFGSNNPTTIIPGVYELRPDGDQNLPISPVEIEITEDGKTYQVPIEAGWINISYTDSDFDYVSKPNSAFIESLDRGNSKYAGVDRPIPVKPGQYKINPRTEQGFMDPIEVVVENNKVADAVFTPKPLGEIVVNFAPSENWKSEPDRAFVTALDGQRIIKGFMRPGRPQKFIPGRYLVVGGGSGGSEAIEQELTVTAHETTTVTLKHQSDN